MSQYFMLECYGPFDRQRAQIKEVINAKGINWMTGMILKDKIPEPIKVELDNLDGMMMPIFKSGILLFSDEVITALKDCGVDNFMTYQSEIHNHWENRIYTNYKAVNIIGLVAVADMSVSENMVHGSPLIDVDFDSLTIDPDKAGDFVFFRLAECVSGIVVHENVKRYFDSKGIKGLDWVLPEDWMG